MTALALPKSSLSMAMSSRQIAEVVRATHDNVLKTIRSLVSRGVVSGNETPYVHPQNGQTYSEFQLDFRNTMVVASGYKAKLRAAIIDRWLELEAAARAPAPTEARLDALETRVTVLEGRLPARLPKPDAAQRILALIQERGAVSKRDIQRRLQNITAAERDSTLEALLATGRIAVFFQTGRIGRPATVCRWVQ